MYCGAIDGAETAIDNLGEWEHHWDAIVLLLKRGAKPTYRLFQNASQSPKLLGDLLDTVDKLPLHSLCYPSNELCLPHYKQMIKRGGLNFIVIALVPNGSIHVTSFNHWITTKRRLTKDEKSARHLHIHSNQQDWLTRTTCD